MKKPISDRAEVGIDFPDKAYHGTFGRGGKYDVSADAHGAHILLSRTDSPRRDVGFHLQYLLLADILADLAAALEAEPPLPELQRERLQETATALRHAVRKRR